MVLSEGLLLEFLGLKGAEGFEFFGAKNFEDFVCGKLESHGKVERQVLVPNRGDGRRGKIDLVFTYEGERVPIELDRKIPRAKSLFKIRSCGTKYAYVITRDPVMVYRA